ncbi:radical SAM family heme chaperone HemW [Sneathiella glossodoripedis]|uniref:radical SAM family heme chaperone HemW n=1 Tax=Sneathiella glossodoripedis TaxID=418853 RepID=UPI000687C99C|nr:radical SAM family heme chaperone HemW [Sneathiella glossodoripedis]
MPASSLTNKPDPGFGVYFHWPFCRKKCPYCDFNSHVRATLDEDLWIKGLTSELRYYAERSDSRRVTSIFFGGGTPSLMSPKAVGTLLDAVDDLFEMSDDVEISLEANPTSSEAESFSGYRLAGVNRLSMGVQSLQDKYLKFLGREHSASEALETIELAKRHYDNISFDLIYALPDQTLLEWESDLLTAMDLAGDHLSLYQLTIEPNTGFAGAYKRGEFQLPRDELAEDMYLLTQTLCGQRGLSAYEISNHARAGYECRHNLTYWRYGSYLGVGPGAHGRLLEDGVRYATAQLKRPESWLRAVTEEGHGTESMEPVGNAQECAEEALLMGMRLSEGVWFENLKQVAGIDFEAVVSKEGLERLLKAGFVEMDAHKIVASNNGRFVLNSVLAELLG